jgi:galactokinase/mevalonate kinase-like predicted kinase
VNQAWEYKSRISDVSSEEVKSTINWGLKNGAIAAKLCGAGGSGFVLFIIDESARANFKNHFTLNRIQEIHIVSKGTEVVYFDDALNRE